MNRYQKTLLAREYGAGDSQPLSIVRKDLSSGMNTRQHGADIAENQATTLYNIDISVVGETTKRLGSVLIGNDIGNVTPVSLLRFEIAGAANRLVMYEDTDVWEWTGSGNWASLKSDFTTSTVCGMVSGKESGLSPDDVFIVQNGVDNAFRFDSAGNAQDLGDTNTSPPKTTVMAWYNNRFWCLLNDLFYWSNAYSGDYAGAFNRTTNAFRVPVGEERKIIPTRDSGMIVCGASAIWSLQPSITPDVTTDQPMPLVPNMGIVSNNAAVAYGDDVFFFSKDGLRSLKRTVQDKLQMGANFPLSFRLKTQFEAISWGNISKLSIEAFDNKIIINVPTGATTFDVWVYYPALDSFVVNTGWSPACMKACKFGGEERLYYGIVGNGAVYRAYYGNTDQGTTTTDGTAINYQEEGRKENLGQPFIKKHGGEVTIVAKKAGDYNISVSASFDEEAYNLLGTINLNKTTITLPFVLPQTFTPQNTVTKKFHLDPYGEWETIQLKLVHNATNSTNDITVLERDIVTYPLEYESE